MTRFRLCKPLSVIVSQAHWLHYVTALETSVSVNLWAASAEETTLNQLMAPPQPCAQADGNAGSDARI